MTHVPCLLYPLLCRFLELVFESVGGAPHEPQCNLEPTTLAEVCGGGNLPIQTDAVNCALFTAKFCAILVGSSRALANNNLGGLRATLWDIIMSDGDGRQRITAAFGLKYQDKGEREEQEDETGELGVDEEEEEGREDEEEWENDEEVGEVDDGGCGEEEEEEEREDESPDFGREVELEEDKGNEEEREDTSVTLPPYRCISLKMLKVCVLVSHFVNLVCNGNNSTA